MRPTRPEISVHAPGRRGGAGGSGAGSGFLSRGRGVPAAGTRHVRPAALPPHLLPHARTPAHTHAARALRLSSRTQTRTRLQTLSHGQTCRDRTQLPALGWRPASRRGRRRAPPRGPSGRPSSRACPRRWSEASCLSLPGTSPERSRRPHGQPVPAALTEDFGGLHVDLEFLFPVYLRRQSIP